MLKTTDELSERELEILRLVATGASNKEIASKLHISANTVKVHLRNIFIKINASSRTEAAMYAVNRGLVPSGVSTEAITVLGEMDTEEAILDSSFVTDEYPKGIRSILDKWKLAMLGGASVILVILSVMYIFWYRPVIQSQVPLSTAATVIQEIPERWQYLTPLPVARSGLGVAVHEGKIYAIAGQDRNGISKLTTSYDPVTNTWIERATKPLPVRDVGAVTIGGKIYVPGGLLPSGNVTDVMQIYDPRQDTWSAGENLPVALSGYALTVFEGKLYLFGGWDGTKCLDKVFSYDPVEDTWIEENTLPKPRAYAGATVSSGKIYLLGGSDGKRSLSATDIYLPDLDSNAAISWEEGPELPTALNHVAATSIADIIFVIGSEDGNGKQTNAWQLLPQTNSWEPFDIPVNGVWNDLGLASLSTKLFLIGGTLNGETTNQQMSYLAIFTLSFPVISK